RTREHAVRASDASRLQRASDDAIFAAFDRIGRTDERAGRLLAVHADHWHSGDAVRPIEEVDVNHRHAAMAVTFGASGYARLAADATGRIDEELVRGHQSLRSMGAR